MFLSICPHSYLNSFFTNSLDIIPCNKAIYRFKFRISFFNAIGYI